MTYAILSFAAVLLILLFFRLMTVISKRRNRLTPVQVADKIERHIQGTEGPFDWDHFTSVPISGERLDAIRLRCIELDNRAPEQRDRELGKIVEDLRREKTETSRPVAHG